jgi:hypothetical protein
MTKHAEATEIPTTNTIGGVIRRSVIVMAVSTTICTTSVVFVIALVRSTGILNPSNLLYCPYHHVEDP